MQDRGSNGLKWSEPDAPKLGETPDKFNCVAVPDGPQEPPGRSGSASQALRDHASGTRGGAAWWNTGPWPGHMNWGLEYYRPYLAPRMGRRGTLGQHTAACWWERRRLTTFLLLRPRDWGNCSFIEVWGTAGFWTSGRTKIKQNILHQALLSEWCGHYLPMSSLLHLWVAHLRATGRQGEHRRKRVVYLVLQRSQPTPTATPPAAECLRGKELLLRKPSLWPSNYLWLHRTHHRVPARMLGRGRGIPPCLI